MGDDFLEPAGERSTQPGDEIDRQGSTHSALLGHYSGPIPPAIEVARLNEISSGLGTRVIEDYLAQQAHERKCDLENLAFVHGNASRADRWLNYVIRGQFYGFVSLICLLSCAAYALWLGHVYVATLLISSGVLGVVAKFIEGRPEAEK